MADSVTNSWMTYDWVINNWHAKILVTGNLEASYNPVTNKQTFDGRLAVDCKTSLRQLDVG